MLMVFFVALLQGVHASCPSGFELIRNGECRGTVGRQNYYYDEAMSNAVAECKSIAGQIPIIHDDEDQSYWNNKEYFYIPLGLVCNTQSKLWEWIDGSHVDYKPPAGNYDAGFPVDGLGDCLSMDTFGVAGQWMNMDCSAKLPVACVRKPNTSYADSCSAGPWKEGQIIYSPGYPYDASIPSDYFLTVDMGKRVEVKVHLLEANSCCDRLLLNDSYLAGNIVANLTGEISEKTYTTKSSNLVRVSWQPNGGVNVRGFMMSYRAV